VKKAKFSYQIWELPEDETISNYVELMKEGFGNAETLERFAEIIQRSYVGDEEYGWTVWNLETKEYLDYRGSTLVDKGRDE
jgi:hypothetical protein